MVTSSSAISPHLVLENSTTALRGGFDGTVLIRTILKGKRPHILAYLQRSVPVSDGSIMEHLPHGDSHLAEKCRISLYDMLSECLASLRRESGDFNSLSKYGGFEKTRSKAEGSPA